MKVGSRAGLVLAILGLAAWTAGALYLGPPQSAFWALAIAAVGLVAAVSAVLPRLRRWPPALFAATPRYTPMNAAAWTPAYHSKS